MARVTALLEGSRVEIHTKDGTESGRFVEARTDSTRWTSLAREARVEATEDVWSISRTSGDGAFLGAIAGTALTGAIAADGFHDWERGQGSAEGPIVQTLSAVFYAPVAIGVGSLLRSAFDREWTVVIRPGGP